MSALPAPDASLVNQTNNLSPDTDDDGGFSLQRRRMRRCVGRHIPEHKCAMCGKYPVWNMTNRNDPKVTIKREVGPGGQAFFGGIFQCGRVWVCPVCAPRITEARRKEVEAVVHRHMKAGGMVYLATFTLPHNKRQPLRDLRATVSNAFTKVRTGKKAQAAKVDAGEVGYVRTLEVTVGEAGWHPHLHVLYLLNHDDATRAQDYGDRLFSRWAGLVEQWGYGRCNRSIWRFERASDPTAAGNYAVKWGCDRELTQTHMKRAKGGGRSPWQLLADICDADDPRDVALFREYARAMHGARQLTWSKGLRELYELNEDASDEDLANKEPEAETLGFLTKEGLKEITDRLLEDELFGEIERRGWAGVFYFCLRFGVSIGHFSPARPPHRSPP